MSEVVCDEHDMPMDRNRSFLGWTCPKGSAAFGDEDYLYLVGALPAGHPEPPQIRVTGCKSRE